MYTLDFNIIDSIPSLNVRKHIGAFIEQFSDSVCEYNAPVHRKFTVWSCWWQGVDDAPEIVKACIKSWRKNIRFCYIFSSSFSSIYSNFKLHNRKYKCRKRLRKCNTTKII